MIYYSLAAAAFCCLFVALRRLRFDRKSIAIILSAALLSISYFFHSSWPLFNHDAIMHTTYVQYIADNFALPPYSVSPASRHPPLFYTLGAGFYLLGQALGSNDPVDYARYVPMALFFGFTVFAALTIRRMFPGGGRPYYTSLMLLVFWPVGITKVGVIHCDILLYVSEMAFIYFALGWLQTRQVEELQWAFVAAGFALLAKNSAILFLLIGMMFWLYALAMNTAPRRELLSWKMFASIIFPAACAHFTFHHAAAVSGHNPIMTLKTHGINDIMRMFFYFNPWEFLRDTMINPHSGETPTIFWHYYLRSLLVGDYIFWKALAVLFAFGFVWLAVISYIVWGLWKIKILPLEQRASLRFLLFLPALLTGMLIYVFYCDNQPTQLADGRYVYPIVCIIAIFYGKAMQWHQQAGRELAVKIGGGLALGFVFLTWILFITQDYILDKIQ